MVSVSEIQILFAFVSESWRMSLSLSQILSVSLFLTGCPIGFLFPFEMR